MATGEKGHPFLPISTGNTNDQIRRKCVYFQEKNNSAAEAKEP